MDINYHDSGTRPTASSFLALRYPTACYRIEFFVFFSSDIVLLRLFHKGEAHPPPVANIKNNLFSQSLRMVFFFFFSRDKGSQKLLGKCRTNDVNGRRDWKLRENFRCLDNTVKLFFFFLSCYTRMYEYEYSMRISFEKYFRRRRGLDDYLIECRREG